MSDQRFDDIRPYHDDEINAAMCRIADNPLLQAVADFLCPGSDIKDLQALFRSIHTSHDFQIKVMHFAINEITRKTSSGVSSNGVTKLDKQTSYLFISNHRDILLDSAIYQVILHENGYKTSEITFGSNLMQPDFVVDIGKSNKMFKVERGLTPRE
ncbi:MAG TPA: acyltransferase, partial [Bacteroidales bacterium]|nr:acyltransferase [Bacteroidales bacterium]